VAQGVVDELEPVEIEEEHVHAGTSRERPLQPVEEQHPIRQAGHGVADGVLGSGESLGVRQRHADLVGKGEQRLLLSFGEGVSGPKGHDREAADHGAVLAYRSRHRRLRAALDQFGNRVR